MAATKSLRSLRGCHWSRHIPPPSGEEWKRGDDKFRTSNRHKLSSYEPAAKTLSRRGWGEMHVTPAAKGCRTTDAGREVDRESQSFRLPSSPPVATSGNMLRSLLDLSPTNAADHTSLGDVNRECANQQSRVTT
jgi:hypothetical protein